MNSFPIIRYGHHEIISRYTVTKDISRISDIHKKQLVDLAKEEDQNTKNFAFCGKLFGGLSLVILILFLSLKH